MNSTRLPSVTPAIAKILRPAVTVWNSGGGIDAPLNRMLASGGATSEGLRPYAKRSAHQFYKIRVVAVTTNGSRSGRAAVISTDARGTGFGLLTWQNAASTPLPGAPHPACDRFLAAIGG